MPEFNMTFLPDRNDVLRILGYKDVKTVPSEVLGELETVIEKVGEIIIPRVFYRTFGFTADEGSEKLITDSGKALTGEYVYNSLKTADYLIVAVSTLGAGMDRLCSQYFEEKDYPKGMMVDAIGISMLNTLNYTFRCEMQKEAEIKGLGVSRKLCPGTHNWNLSDQRVIFELLEKDISGLHLNDSFMISPMKSDTSVLGAGAGMGSNTSHDCENCGLKHCQFRMEDPGHAVRVNKGGKVSVLSAKSGTNLLKLLRENGFMVYNACGGNGTCGKCKVRMEGQRAEMLTAQEKKLLKTAEINGGIRLACQTEIISDSEIYLDKAAGKPKILVKGMKSNNGMDNAMGRYEVPGKKGFGVAMDIGTTTIAAYLIDLGTGRTLDTCASLNPQRYYGSDVISRINYTIMAKGGLAVLQKLVVEELDQIIGKLAGRSPISRNEINRLVAVGNTTMLHMLLGVPCSGIAFSPFTPGFTEMKRLRASDINLHINREGELITLPCRSGYVGADTVAAVLASGMHKEEDICLLLDIGTNGELVLGNRDRLLCCAAAAGPAFEGANIRHGMGAVEGAIDHVRLDKKVEYTTIGAQRPKGICGSGIVDAVAELVKVGLVDTGGRMLKKDQLPGRVRDRFADNLLHEDGKLLFVLDRETEICVTQRDVRELQLAKAAIFSGIMILANTMGIGVKDIKKIYLSGGFGNYIDIGNAIAIGLLPDEGPDKVRSIGNAAGAGAGMALVSDEMLLEAIRIKEQLEYIELSGLALFETEFINNIGFE